MRASELLFEDHRSTIEKLEELIAHPQTEDTVRAVAQTKLKTLRDNLPAVTTPQQRISIPVNLDEGDLDNHFLPGITLGHLYEGLSQLSPPPNRIQFLKQGQIQMMVPPPFMGKTKPEYMAEINRVCRGARAIDSRMIEGQGYYFVISYI